MSRIEVRGLTKTFGDVRALDNVTLTLEEGKIYGLLGRNGAGKTTLLNAMTGRIFADNGTITIDGENAVENDSAQAKLYMMSEKRTHAENMRVSEVFKWTSHFHDGAFDTAFADRLCDAFGLNTRKKVRQLSTGYASIYKNIAALALRVPVLLLDEPVLGLDANHRDLLYRVMLEDYAENPRTIVISTHLIEEVSTLIEEVIIIKDGRILRQSSSEELLSGSYSVSGPAQAVDAYISGRQVVGTDTLGGLKTAYIQGEVDRDALTPGLEVGRMDLQKLFIQLTNQ